MLFPLYSNLILLQSPICRFRCPARLHLFVIWLHFPLQVNAAKAWELFLTLGYEITPVFSRHPSVRSCSGDVFVTMNTRKLTEFTKIATSYLLNLS